jgi:PTH1 family peptidyl-tRNA hydrolase
VKLIVGLGNPGPRYAGTRHNVGFDVVDLLASRWGVGMQSEKFHAWFGLGETGGERVALLKPTTYMNRSGQAVFAAGKFYKLELPDILVIVDDHALPLGRLRMRKDGSAGSHNGLQDIVDRLGSENWCRLRIGIGESVGDPKDYVLSRFEEPEEAVIRVARARAADAVECWIKNGPDLAMTKFNGDVVSDDAKDEKEA